MLPEQAKSQVFKYSKYIRQLAKKQFAQDHVLASDYVFKKLSENNWQRICTYQQDDFKTFITVVVIRLLTTCAQDPQFLFYKHLDYLKKMANTYFYPDKQLAESAIDYMLEHLERNHWQQIYKYKGQGFTAFIKKVAENQFKDFIRKGKLSTMSAEEETMAQIADPGQTPPDTLSQQVLEKLFTLIHQLQVEQGTPPTEQTRCLQTWSQQLRQYLATTGKSSRLLTHEEYLFLALIYQDELTVSEAGRCLHWNENQAQGRHRRLLARLYQAFEHCHIAKDLKPLLDE